MRSARPDSAGAIRCMTGTRSKRAATIGGSAACVGRSRLATSFASTISAASKPTGKFPPTNRRRSTARWVKGPNAGLFHALKRCAGQVAVHCRRSRLHHARSHELRKTLEIPGMKILQFGFGNKGAHVYLPHRYEPDCVVYTGTHDNDTSSAGGTIARPKKRRSAAATYLNIARGGHCLGVHSRRAYFGREPGYRSCAGCARPGQRRSHECSQRDAGKLGVAAAQGALTSSWQQGWRAGGDNRSRRAVRKSAAKSRCRAASLSG